MKDSKFNHLHWRQNCRSDSFSLPSTLKLVCSSVQSGIVGSAEGADEGYCDGTLDGEMVVGEKTGESDGSIVTTGVGLSVILQTPHATGQILYTAGFLQSSKISLLSSISFASGHVDGSFISKQYVGWDVGEIDGDLEGAAVGSAVVGERVGVLVGEAVGSFVGP